jgi:hypothetical protein
MLQLCPAPRRPIAFAVVALALASLSGCVPTVWLPDSSGFIYIKPIKVAGSPSGQLAHYDLQKKTSRVIVEDIGAATTWPAVSPDGKRIAVARLADGPKDAQNVQIAIYDLQGKQLHLSKVLAWAPAQGKGSLPEFILFWSPTNDMVVVSDAGETGIYNVKADTLKVIARSIPLIYGGTPIRPDGSGFLAMMGEKDDQRVVFMDWEGKDEKIDADAFVALLPKDKSPGSPIGMSMLASMLLPSWWDGRAAWVGSKRDKTTFAIDTARKKIDFTDALAASMKADKKDGMPMRFDFAGDITVQAVQIHEMNMAFRKIIAVNNKSKKEETLLAKGPDITLFLPSPDGTYLGLCLTSVGPGMDDQILVINNKGELVSKLNFEQR